MSLFQKTQKDIIWGTGEKHCIKIQKNTSLGVLGGTPCKIITSSSVTCYTQISVFPKIVDFGEIDIGMVSDVRFLTMTNSGTKQAQYSIDLGRNPLEVIVQPIKGTVQPGESKKISIEIFGTDAGEFKQEFWIKTNPLQRVHIQGNFIEPTLKVDYPFGDRNILILYFPKTFVGVRQQRNVVIKNHSSTSAVFCVMGRTRNEKFPLKHVEKTDINYRQFYIHPMEGRLHSEQQYIMGLTFVPQKLKNRPDYYICSVIVDVKKCRVGNATKPEPLHPETQNANNSPLLDSISITSLDEQNEPEQRIESLNDMLTILLYGEVESPEITIEPKKLYLNNLKVNEIHTEPLKILNSSKTLPLFLKYNKVACVEVEPKTIILPPNEVAEVLLKLKPSKLGDIVEKVVFDICYRQYQHVYKLGTMNYQVFYSGEYTENLKLLQRRKSYFVTGITPLVTNEVGYQVDDVRFNTEMEMPIQAIVDKNYLKFDKNNNALIAFPNDRPKVLRPWRNTVPCKTIFAKLPRIITGYDKDYQLSPSEKLLQETNQSYYKSYINTLALKQQSKELDDSLEDYVTTNEKLPLMQNLNLPNICPPIVKNLTKHTLFVPLTPYEVHDLVVTPKFIQLGKLAADTDSSNNFNVENKNSFPVHVSIRPLYPSITIHQDQVILASNTQKSINFTYHSDSSGTHHIPVFVIFNFFHIFDVTVLAKIVSKSVKCVTKDILIVPTEKTAFMELRNPINSDVKFVVDTTFFNLESFPSSGVIPAKRNMICTITFNPEVGYMPVKEISVVSESGAKELVEVHFDRKKATVALSAETLNFGDIPLNTLVSQELTIRNNSDQLVPVNIEIENSDLFPEIRINPMRALLWQKADIIITFSVKFKEVVQFKLPVKIIFQYEYPQIVTVTGNVVFPNIKLSPGLIKIQKIPSGSVVKTPFKVSNHTNVTNFMTFPFHDYSEFTIKTKNGENVTDGLTLKPKEKKELSLEFYPQEPVAYCIYFPYILNGVVGPPELNRPDSLKCSGYLPQENNKYKTPREITSRLKVMKILCASGKLWLEFSCMKMNFCTVDQPNQEFTVTNVGTAIYEITFKMTDTKCFKLIPSNYNNMVIIDRNFKAILEPEESFKITVEFHPRSYGTFNAQVPIYVREYSEILVYNYLELNGIHLEPQIIPSKRFCYFLPTYAGSRLEQSLTLELIAHTCDGNVNVNCGNSDNIDVWNLKKEPVTPMKTTYYYNIVFAPKNDCVIETKVKFSCLCNASAEIAVYACADSSLVINFMADPEGVEHSTYPFFPKDDDKSSYAGLMFSIVPIIERWIYSQGFVYQNYYKIPDNISRYPVNTDGKKRAMIGKKETQQLPLVQLLINLMNKSILKYIDNKIKPTEDLRGRTVYNYVTYRNTISFLKSQGMWVPGLKPEHLLPYVEYVEFKTNFVDNARNSIDENFSEDEFYRFSKQKWLDLFFRIYKILVLQRIVDSESNEDERRTSENYFINKDKEAFQKYFKRKAKWFPNWFTCDAKLLLWLQYHYNRQKSILWPEEKFQGQLHLKSFCDITDGVALATVTAAYCPYFKEQLRDMYAYPKQLEHKVHNACKIVQVWKILKLSFDIHPQTIVRGNRVKLLFIVTYLYEVLPYLYPTSEVKIEAPLSEHASYELTVTNCGDVPIKYTALFFGEGKELFQLDTQQIVIPVNAPKKLRLTYFAKKVLKASSILVLSGEGSGQKYAQSLVISITGIPKISECAEIKMQVETYQQVREKITLQSPYAKSYTAKIYVCFEEPKSYKDFHAISAIKAKNIPREVNVVQNDCNFIEKGASSITLELCFISQGPVSFYLYFCNNDIGDFCVLISIISITKRETAEVVLVVLPDNFGAPCSCKRGLNIHCPKSFRIDIPCRNPLLWACTDIVVQRCIYDASAWELIRKFLGTPIIFRMLKFYLERFPEGFLLESCIFEDHANFVIAHNKKISTSPSTLKIRDVTSEDTVQLVVHWNNTEMPQEEYLELRNTNKREVRFFKLVFPKSDYLSTSTAGDSDKRKRSTIILRQSTSRIK